MIQIKKLIELDQEQNLIAMYILETDFLFD
jgi:hypothetical protein